MSEHRLSSASNTGRSMRKKIAAPLLLASTVAFGAAAYKSATAEVPLPPCGPGQPPEMSIGAETPTVDDMAKKFVAVKGGDFTKERTAIIDANHISDVGNLAAGTILQVCKLPEN